MTRYIARRFIAALFQACLVLVITFTLVRLTPGDPVLAYLSRVQSETRVSQEQIARIRRTLGLDDPLPIQFGLYVGRIARGDLGISYTQSEPVLNIIADQLPYTLELALAALLIEIVIGVPLGVYAATHRGSVLDYLATTAATAAYSMPRFLVGMILILTFAVGWGIFPVIGVGEAGDVGSLLHHLVLPALSLGLAGAAYITRMTRSAMLEVLGEDYVRTARAKGLAEHRVLTRHALRSALIPLVTVVGVSVGRSLGGSAIIETLFGRVGIGSLLIESITQRDYSVTQGTVLVFALGVFAVNILVDLTYAWLNPRIRYV